MKKIDLYFPPINKLGNIAFREVCLNSGADFVCTEMITVDKLLGGDEIQLKKLEISEFEKDNIIVQIICEDINLIEKGVDFIYNKYPFIKEINYNMGCPQSTLCKKECGAGIIGNVKKVEEVAIRLSSACTKYNIKSSIKIRLGLTRDKITIFDNAKVIENARINKLYIHGRTLDDTYIKSATYDEIKKVKELFPKMQIIANGDVKDLTSFEKIIKTNCDGVLIGRAALENPLIFQEIGEWRGSTGNNNKNGFKLEDRKVMILDFLASAKKYNLDLSKIKANLAYMTKNIIGANILREKINNAKSIDEIIIQVEDF